MKVVADIKTISATVTIFVCPFVSALKKVLERFAPKNLALWADNKRSPLRKPWDVLRAIPFRTVKSAKKIGA